MMLGESINPVAKLIGEKADQSTAHSDGDHPLEMVTFCGQFVPLQQEKVEVEESQDLLGPHCLCSQVRRVYPFSLSVFHCRVRSLGVADRVATGVDNTDY